MRFPAGHRVRVEFSKWGGKPHWAYDGHYLGADEYGEWIGHRSGTHCERPGAAYEAEWTWLTLVPAGSAAYVATFNSPDHPHVNVYVDITDVARWEGEVVRAVDLDLDVVQARPEHDERGAFVDDEDEFAEHQVELGYPADLVKLAEATARSVLLAVRSKEAPFDRATPSTWFDRLTETTR